MWIPLLFFSLYLSNAVCQSFITIRDEKFEGPDQVLTAELERRSKLQPQSAAELQRLLNRSAARPPRRPQPTASDTQVAKQRLVQYVKALALRSGTESTVKKGQPWRFPDPTMQKIYDLILFLILRVKERMEDLRPILVKYQSDPRIRLGHIYCKLDKWKLELIAIFMGAWRFKDRSMGSHIVQYQRLLAKNIDITYTVEYLITIQNYFMDMAKEFMGGFKKEDLEQYKMMLELQKKGIKV